MCNLNHHPEDDPCADAARFADDLADAQAIVHAFLDRADEGRTAILSATLTARDRDELADLVRALAAAAAILAGDPEEDPGPLHRLAAAVALARLAAA
ncbi:hypothetical protein [Kocuria rosea]|uniref:hypothetical protein n=1 Tax=Kocuria rosea TaxID=1275 RepID=UPI000D644CB1|nr:hypothetical protein [Kocuria rosea]PWF88690.1 hypothetical protein DEJ37_06270 [Kocuria rosea]STX02475.1 Uncharacterised protein [Kocuria rosea]